MTTECNDLALNTGVSVMPSSGLSASVYQAMHLFRADAFPNTTVPIYLCLGSAIQRTALCILVDGMGNFVGPI